MTKNLHCRFLLRIASGLILYSSLSTVPMRAQEADGPDDESFFELPPFEVSTEYDRGYISTNTTSGTSLNTLIRDLPMPLEVLNQEFMQDIQATDMAETLAYSAGVFTQTHQNTSGAVVRFAESSPSAVGNVNDPFQNAISIRGYQVPNQQRLGFRVGGIVPAYGVVLGGNTDVVTTERTEVVRGPNALLYGINVLSGIVNLIPKRPLSEPRQRVGLTVGSHGLRRGTLDVTGPIVSDKLNYRLMSAYHEQDDPLDDIAFRQDERWTVALQFDYKINRTISLFAEYLHSERERSGIGPQFFVDDGNNGESQFPWENQWGESIRYGRDDPTRPVLDGEGNPWNPIVDVPGRDYAFPDLGRQYNISGPDTYLKREENNFLALLTITPIENLSFELGAYFTEIEDEEFNVDLVAFTNRRFAITPGVANSSFNPNRWIMNPEAAAADALNDPISYGLGVPMAFPRRVVVGDSYQYAPPNQGNPEAGNPGIYDRKFARYIWYRTPTTSETAQLRGRAAYRLENEMFDIPMDHTFVLGYHYIADDVSFVRGSVDDRFTYAQSSRREMGREDQDPVYFRDSVLDYTPLRYSGEVVAIPGIRSQTRLGGIPADDLDVARSGWMDANMWYRGLYGIYQGQFWQDRLTVIGGLRRDAYQAKEKERLMIVDKDRLSDSWVGFDPATVPGFIGYGDRPYEPRSDLPEALNTAAFDSIERIRASQPNGTIEHLFPEAQTFTTGTFGFSWRATEALSVYALYSEGVFPNTGQRDGADNPIDAEQTVNNEVGIKFDLFDGKLSGTLSAFRIKRTNAVYNWGAAPAPYRWHGGSLAPADPAARGTFSPQAAEGPGSDYLEGRHEPRSYAVAEEYVRMAAYELGREAEYHALTTTEDGQFLIGDSTFDAWGADTAYQINVPGTRSSALPLRDDFVFVNYDVLKNDPNAEVLKRAFDLAVSRAPVEDPETGEVGPYAGGFGEPLFYGIDTPNINNPSEGRGTTVVFEEEGIGFDGQLIYAPIPNYQLIFSVSVQEREIVGRGFTLVDAVDENGKNWGTEYDYWVYVLGPDNFEDPTRPSTFTGGSVKGLDLSFVPKESFRLWNKYRFVDGPMSGFEVGGGVQYNGSAPTSTPIGGNDLAQNRFLTPDTPEHYSLDAFLSYRTEFWGADWRFSLNVTNLLNDDEETVTSIYPDHIDIYGESVKRRTLVYYQPRGWRLSVSAAF